jgi:copper chaperone CopZ
MKTTVTREGMSCEHCVKHVKEALEAISGIKSAKVSLKNKRAVVDHKDGVTLESIKASIAEAGYVAID